ncbi:trans-aconitate 2-methyltransferase [Paenibacillus sp. OV219]|uniref:class I SAM-dependent methyltransferase n=1 Tax=Paenibacillus sp. OV219 TaxID=1884377 RepID=UPI0008B4852F|nr:class I SAM-dependent methyltransferase [Paenibacillus sp. OV219]SEO47853.1 tRNA (cmo5U34)-methyltransferase [Paenibacillus sp. OV219]
MENQASANQHVHSTFNETAAVYDQQRRKLIPCFDDFYGVAASLADSQHEAPKILDLGAGTGLFASLLVQRYPNASLTLIDLADNMLDVARARFSGNPNVQYVCADYTNFVTPDSYDIIISGLSIHHLLDADKVQLYKNSWTNLRESGVLINADQVLGHTPFIDERYKSDWRGRVEASGLSGAEIAAAYERTKLDRMTDLSSQLGWLTQAGFQDVDCVYKYYNFVVMFGRKMAE